MSAWADEREVGLGEVGIEGLYDEVELYDSAVSGWSGMMRR